VMWLSTLFSSYTIDTLLHALVICGWLRSISNMRVRILNRTLFGIARGRERKVRTAIFLLRFLGRLCAQKMAVGFRS
jgi:hypothetical protein